jgi:hypothetical protein
MHDQYNERVERARKHKRINNVIEPIRNIQDKIERLDEEIDANEPDSNDEPDPNDEADPHNEYSNDEDEDVYYPVYRTNWYTRKRKLPRFVSRLLRRRTRAIDIEFDSVVPEAETIGNALF